MTRSTDPLYSIFEHHLLNALVEEETSDEFVTRVVRDYLLNVSHKAVIMKQHQAMIEEDLRDEVLEMLRKKIYGHFSLADFRKSKTARASATIDSSRLRPRRPA